MTITSARLQQALNETNELFTLLQQEQQHLIERKIDEMAALLEQKLLLLQRVQVFAEECKNALNQAHLSQDANGMQTLLQTQTQDSKHCVELWKTFSDRLKKIKTINQINSGLVHKLTAFNQAAMQVLHQEMHGPQLYGAKGQTVSLGNSRGVVAK